MILRPLPVRQPRELVRFVTIRPILGTRSDFNYPFLRRARGRCRTVRDLFAWQPFDVALTSGGSPERIHAEVTPAQGPVSSPARKPTPHECVNMAC